MQIYTIRKALRHLHEEAVTRRALQVNSGRSYPTLALPDHIITALEDSIAVWPAYLGPIPNITPAPAPPPTMPSADTLSSLSVRRHPPLLFPPRKVPRTTSSPNRPSEIAREPVHDDGLDTSKG